MAESTSRRMFAAVSDENRDKERIQAWFDGWGGMVFGVMAVLLVVTFIVFAVFVGT